MCMSVCVFVLTCMYVYGSFQLGYVVTEYLYVDAEERVFVTITICDQNLSRPDEAHLHRHTLPHSHTHRLAHMHSKSQGHR